MNTSKLIISVKLKHIITYCSVVFFDLQFFAETSEIIYNISRQIKF